MQSISLTQFPEIELHSPPRRPLYYSINLYPPAKLRPGLEGRQNGTHSSYYSKKPIELKLFAHPNRFAIHSSAWPTRTAPPIPSISPSAMQCRRPSKTCSTYGDAGISLVQTLCARRPWGAERNVLDSPSPDYICWASRIISDLSRSPDPRELIIETEGVDLKYSTIILTLHLSLRSSNI
jgi:hypothetical protein